MLPAVKTATRERNLVTVCTLNNSIINSSIYGLLRRIVRVE